MSDFSTDIEPMMIQKIVVQLKEGETVDWADAQDPMNKQVASIGRTLYKVPCKGGWVIFVLTHDYLKFEDVIKPKEPESEKNPEAQPQLNAEPVQSV